MTGSINQVCVGVWRQRIEQMHASPNVTGIYLKLQYYKLCSFEQFAFSLRTKKVNINLLRCRKFMQYFQRICYIIRIELLFRSILIVILSVLLYVCVWIGVNA